MLIDEEKTFREKGYYSTDLSYGSTKRVYRVCAGCKKGRWIEFRKYHDLCNKCACETDEFRRKSGERSEEGAIRMRDFQTGMRASDESRRKNSESHIGSKNPRWKGGITHEKKKFYNSRKYAEWRISVFERDKYTCQECLERGVVLNAHHILPYRDYKDPEFSLSVDNGITLCEKCHNEISGREYEFVERYQINVNDKCCEIGIFETLQNATETSFPNPIHV